MPKRSTATNRTFTPRPSNEDWRTAYGLECWRIYREAFIEQEHTGQPLTPWYPTPEEYQEARRIFRERRIFNPSLQETRNETIQSPKRPRKG